MPSSTRSFLAPLPALGFLFALSAAAQPTNDDFANAQAIPVDQPLPIITSTSTVGATVEAAETALDPTLAASVWFKVTSPVDDVVQLDTFGSDFQTRLVVGVGSSLATLDVIAADHEPRNGTSVVFEINTGVEYHFGVFGWDGETGNLSLNLREITGGAISGTVTAASGGAPLGQIQMEALSFNNVLNQWWVVARTTTNDLGGYTLSGLREGVPHRVRAVDVNGTHAPQFHTAATFVDDALSVTPNATLFGIDLALPAAGSISGEVRNSEAAGLDGITARAFIWNSTAAEWQFFGQTTSAPDGSFTLSGLPAGNYRISFEDEAAQIYLPSFYNGSADLASAQDIVVTSGANLTGYVATLQTAGSIQGIATHGATGIPLAGIRVQALFYDVMDESWQPTGRRAITEADGRYTIPGLPYDTYKVVFVDFEDSIFHPILFGGTTDPDTATSVVLTPGSPAATNIDQGLQPVRVTDFASAGGGQYTLSFLGNAFAQFVIEKSTTLSGWTSPTLPFNPAYGIDSAMVMADTGLDAQFWRLRGPTNLGLTPQANIHEKTSHATTQAQYRWIDRYQFISDGFLSAFGYSDFNGDGKTDALTFPGQFLTLVPEPAHLTLDIDGSPANGASVFIGGVAGALHPRKLLVGDLNGDMINDAVLIDHGYDADPFPGAPLQVLLSAPGGMITTTIYPEHTGFHHAGALGDVDHDGDLDLFLAAPKDLGDINLILANDGTGTFTPTTQLVGEIWDKNIWSSEFFDLDGDGYLDLAIGGSLGQDPAAILWGSSRGTYGASLLPLDLPEGWEVYDYDAEDIDNDGDRDLLVTLANIDTDQHQFRLFINQGGRVFLDETSPRFDDPTYGARWIDFVFLQDEDSDGDLDIVTDVWGTLLKWENDGVGNFRFRQQ
jgi:hypothetical protein